MSPLNPLGAAGARIRITLTQLLSRFGAGGNSFLVILAVVIGLVTAAAAVGFHELIIVVRNLLYERIGEEKLYGRFLFLLIVWPALGGLAVGVISRYIARAREGHGIVDVMESVIRSRGFIKPSVAIEKIVTSAITIGTGGSCGAEGPIVQIGAAISSGIGSVFRVTQQQMPTLIACGAAAGISAIFNSPMGGMLFALEVILLDFSVRSVTPVVVASVIANVATQAIFRHFFHANWEAIFHLPGGVQMTSSWSEMGSFAFLGIACGIVGVALTKAMYVAEEQFHRIRINRAIRPAIGGAMLGLLGIGYVWFFGRFLLGTHKPIPFGDYPMPAFFGDGYGFIQMLLTSRFYGHERLSYFVYLLLFLLVAKVVGTCLTLGSGGSGGVIAPALFLGAVTGALVGIAVRATGIYPPGMVHPEVYALVGMGAVLAAIVHAPLASILILLDLTRDSSLVLPAMLATVIATGTARLILPDSIYTLALRRRGLRVSSGVDASLLHRMTVEQVELEPAVLIKTTEPFQKVLDLMNDSSRAIDYAVVNDDGAYVGMMVAEDVRTVLLEREAIPLLLVKEMLRADVPVALTTDDLAKTMDAFTKYDVSHLAVCFPAKPDRVIGLIGRAATMRRYQQALQRGG